MMGKPQYLEPKLFYHGVNLEQRVPADHPLRQIKQGIDFGFIRSRVADLYGQNGHVSVDPTVILKLMFLLFYENVTSERALMEQLPLRLDWLWFCDYDLDEATPHHSILSKARRRWGTEVFSAFFAQILRQCLEAGLVDGRTVHVDSSMIAADAAKDSLQPQLQLLGQHLYARLEEQSTASTVDAADPPDDSPENDSSPETTSEAPLEQRVSTTDSDARLGKKYGHTTLGYKDHRVVDDSYGIITTTLTTPANINDEKLLPEALEAHQRHTALAAQTVVADKAYGAIDNYRYLQEEGMTPCISHKRHPNIHPDLFDRDQFRYDSRHDVYICPAGHCLKRRGVEEEVKTTVYRIDRAVCEACAYLAQCVHSDTYGRTVSRKAGTDAMEWADACLIPAERKRLLARRKAKAEGSFADAANQHGFKRARWRGLVKMTMQNLIIAAVQNLRKLMRYAGLGGDPAVGRVPDLFLDSHFAPLPG